MKITGFMYSFIAHNGQEKMVAASFGTSRTKAKKYFNAQNNLQRLEPIKPHKLYEVSIVVGAEADRAKLKKQEHSGIGNCAMCGAAYEDQVIKAPAEPVAWADMGTCDVDNDAGLSWTPGHFHTTPLYTTPPAQPAPVQEPVAFFDPQGKGFYWAKPTQITAPVTVDVEPLPLYTTPPAQRQWVGLTNEEIAQIYLVNTDKPLKADWLFARAIERKLKELNT